MHFVGQQHPFFLTLGLIFSSGFNGSLVENRRKVINENCSPPPLFFFLIDLSHQDKWTALSLELISWGDI